MKILILKPSSLGDVVQAIPVLRLLKSHVPDAEIFWWIDSGLAPLLEGDPDLSGIVRFERKRWGSPRHWPEMIASIRWLRAQRFDWVIDLQGLLRSGAFAWLANGGLVVGLDERREGATGFYDVVVPRGSYYTHAVDWYLAILPKLGVPIHQRFAWMPERPDVAAAFAEKFHPPHGPWIALSPGARWLNKRWPKEHFAAVVRELARRHEDAKFAVIGSKEDRSLGQELAAEAPERCLDLTGRTSLPEMVEWLRRCAVLVTNDSGPMHVAAAMGKPVLALFGPTEPRRTGPYGQTDFVLRKQLPCAPCMKDYCVNSKQIECLTEIHPALVVERACQVLANESDPEAARG